MLVDVFTVQSSVIICLCRQPFDLYCLADTPPTVSEFSPESLDRVNYVHNFSSCECFSCQLSMLSFQFSYWFAIDNGRLRYVKWKLWKTNMQAKLQCKLCLSLELLTLCCVLCCVSCKSGPKMFWDRADVTLGQRCWEQEPGPVWSVFFALQTPATLLSREHTLGLETGVYQLWDREYGTVCRVTVTAWHWIRTISQLPKLCVKISILMHRRMWVRSFSTRLTSMTFAENKVLIFLILRKNAKIVQLWV